MACDNAVKECLPCDDSPIVNLSAEAPDVPVYFAQSRYVPDIPGNSQFTKQGCVGWCFSTVSQQAADDCALAQAQDCVVNPGGGGGDGGPCVGICTPGGGSGSFFSSTEQSCGGTCGDGSPILYILPPDAYRSLISQADAESRAAGICRRRLGDLSANFCEPLAKACFNADEAGTEYTHQFPQLGGSPPWSYSLYAGSLPPGLTLSGAGTLQGIPQASGTYNFTFEAVDLIGGIVRRACTLIVVEITTAAELPEAPLGAPYSETLAQTGGTEPLSWTVIPDVGEGLPPGLTLNEQTGEISGTPEDDPEAPADGIYHFRVRLQDEAT